MANFTPNVRFSYREKPTSTKLSQPAENTDYLKEQVDSLNAAVPTKAGAIVIPLGNFSSSRTTPEPCPETIFLWDAGFVPAGKSVYLEVSAFKIGGGNGYVKLRDVTGAADVAGSTLTVSSGTGARYRSGALTLTTAHAIQLQAWADTTSVSGSARLIIM